MTFSELLAQPGVVEEVEMRGAFGFFAYHGGPVERVTSLIGRAAAERAGATFYGIDQPGESPLHLPSTRFDPSESTALTQVLTHIDTVCTVHGYGRELERQRVLLGGQNRELAQIAYEELTARLPDTYRVVVDLEDIPKELRGVHAKNPVNLPSNQGVQVELPPGLRWNRSAHTWGDSPGLEPTVGITAVIDSLAAMAQRWAAEQLGP